jgi:1,4-dihydroxy-2-naphthoate octaprenyltransferase
MKGTDNEDRVGAKRAIQSGATPQQMKGAIIITAVLTLAFAILLIYFALRTQTYTIHYFIWCW